jgi:outer membrane protein insertion porin family
LKFFKIIMFFIFSFSQLTFAVENLGPAKKLFKVDQIEISGLRRVEKEAVLEKLSIKIGTIVDNYQVDKEIRNIYSLKFFDFIEAHHEVKNGKDVLVFKVKERPVITAITLEGNDDLSDDDLKKQIKIKEFSLLDITSVKSDLVALEKFYEEKGYFLAAVTYEVKPTEEGTVELVFKIKEFDKIKIKKIDFTGNRAFLDNELKAIMETREESMFSFLTGAGSFKEINFNTDIERIKYFYKIKGYLQVNVGNPEVTVSEDKKWVFISLKINEGPQFTINNIYFAQDEIFSDEDFRKALSLKEGEIYSEENLRKDINSLTELFQDKGYAFANVLRTLDVVPGENKVDIKFSFEKGKVAYIGKINIIGNTKTRDKVIRRELKIYEGMKFSGSMLRRSKENVGRLGFFEAQSITFNTISRKDKDDVLDIEISVQERNTGQISLGAGYSSATGFFLQGSVSQNNFRGMGQNLAVSLNLAKKTTSFNISFTEPYFFDSKWTSGGDVYSNSDNQTTSYKYSRYGFDARVGYPVWDYTRLFFTYSFDDLTIKDVYDPTVDVAINDGIASTVNAVLVADKRNNVFEPTSGFYINYLTEYTGLGGDKKWFKNEVDGRYFYPVVGDLVFRTRLFVGDLEEVNNQEIPRTEKYLLGGPKNLRGFPYEAIGNTYEINGVPYNSGTLFSSYASFEFEHPLAREAGMKWVVFADTGYAGQLDLFKLYTDWGFGIRWFSPIGILRFEYGIPFQTTLFNQKSEGQFIFDIGQLF